MDHKKKEIAKLKETISNYEIENSNLKQINELRKKTKSELLNNAKNKGHKNSLQVSKEPINTIHNPKKACI